MGTVVSSWRLGLIILIIILLTSVYIVNGFFFFVDIDESGYIVPDDDIDFNETNLETAGQEESNDFMSVLFGVGSYLTFGNIDNAYARIILNLFTSICWISIGYILYTFIKEWVPFV